MAQLLSLYGLDEKATGADPSILDDHHHPAPKAKLGTFHWKPANQAYSVITDAGGSSLTKDLGEGFNCFITAMPSDAHSHFTARGTPGQKDWIVDAEIVTVGEDGVTKDFIYHVEKRVPTQGEALKLRKQLMDFIDSKTMHELIQIPRSGKISMSRFP